MAEEGGQPPGNSAFLLLGAFPCPLHGPTTQPGGSTGRDGLNYVKSTGLGGCLGGGPGVVLSPRPPLLCVQGSGRSLCTQTLQRRPRGPGAGVPAGTSMGGEGRCPRNRITHRGARRHPKALGNLRCKRIPWPSCWAGTRSGLRPVKNNKTCDRVCVWNEAEPLPAKLLVTLFLVWVTPYGHRSPGRQLRAIKRDGACHNYVIAAEAARAGLMSLPRDAITED